MITRDKRRSVYERPVMIIQVVARGPTVGNGIHNGFAGFLLVNSRSVRD